VRRAGIGLVAATVAGVLLFPGAALAGAGQATTVRRDVTTIAVYGDAPYGTSPTDTAQLAATPAFIQAVDADPDVTLVAQVGDIHSGKQYCTRAYDQQIADLWSRFTDPLVYTPGDNEWADCHKAAQGGGTYNAASQQIDYVKDAAGNPVDYANGDPVANLALVRSLFFPHPGLTLGAHRRVVVSQALLHDPRHPEDGAFVENVLWVASGVVFATVNLPGGSNNDSDVWYGAPAESPAQTRERVTRTAADLRWLDAAFTLARGIRAKGVVIGSQADMWDPEKGAAHQAGYEPLVNSLAEHSTAFGGPVLLLNGDSHVYRSDNPLSASAPCSWESATPCTSVASVHPGYQVPNFHRIVVHGSTFPLEWLKLTIDPAATAGNGPTAFGPFSWERRPVA
jgi:hypothetical protein